MGNDSIILLKSAIILIAPVYVKARFMVSSYFIAKPADVFMPRASRRRSPYRAAED